MDVPAPGVGAVCGDCPLGYTGDSSKCYGIKLKNVLGLSILEFCFVLHI